VIQSSDQPAKVESVLLTMRTSDGPGGANGNSNVVSTDIPSTAGRRAWAHMQKFDKPDPNSETDLNAQAAAAAAFGGDANVPAPAEPAAARRCTEHGPCLCDGLMHLQPQRVLLLRRLRRVSADAKSAVPETISSMQMFDQRRQMIQKQNTAAGQNAGPSSYKDSGYFAWSIALSDRASAHRERCAHISVAGSPQDRPEPARL
jgi:hypothetical protein